MARTKNKYDQVVTGVRAKTAFLRDILKQDFGATHDQFYHETVAALAKEEGTSVSKTWVRDQCNVDHPSEPAYAKFQALKEFVERMVAMVEGQGAEPEVRQDDPDDARERIEADYIEQAVIEEDVSKAVKFLMTDTNKALLKIAKLSQQLLKKHTDRGGSITPFVNYLRTRAAFSYNTELSIAPIYALRNINTLEDAQATNPGLKTTLALYSVMIAINGTRTNFPWGKDDEIRHGIKEMEDAMGLNRGPRDRKKPKTMFQMNRELARQVRGTKKKA